MKIDQIIKRIINYHRGILDNKKITSQTTRDKVLYGQKLLNSECTGIVTTCWATVDVINKAHKFGANLIICHEALFWNHGDKQQWLEESENKTYLQKERLLDKYRIVVWRDHDYIHSGIPTGDGWKDGIFYGFNKCLGWPDSCYKGSIEGKLLPVYYEIPETTVQDVANQIIEKLHLKGAKIEGKLDSKVKKIMLTHNPGDAKTEIKYIEKHNIDLVIGMEVIDFTLAEYIRDSSMLGRNKALITVGHFNTEEAGMKYMTTWLSSAIDNKEIPIKFMQSGDMYHYICVN